MVYSNLNINAKVFVSKNSNLVSANIKTCEVNVPNTSNVSYLEPPPNTLSLGDESDCSMNNEDIPQLDNDKTDVYSILKDLRIKNLDRILIGSLNINSIRNKFHMLTDFVVGHLDFLLIAESNLDDSFPNSSLKLPVFLTPFRRDRTCFGGGLLVYVREDIPATLLSSMIIPESVECLIIEIRLKKVKWILINLYNPSKGQISSQLSFLSREIDHYAMYYDNILILGDFNAEMSENSMFVLNMISKI